MYNIMTPGPTKVVQSVRDARALECTNPDIDVEFVEFYHNLCEKISRLLHTENETIILDGEGILALEAACASLTEPGDNVLVIDNGLYGKGFEDFVKMYGGNVTLYTSDYKNPVNPQDLKSFLDKNHDFKYATVVHCDTPSAMLNPIDQICPLLKEYGIMTVVDSVSAMFGEPVETDKWQIDVLCGGSQKAISAPPGLCFNVLSDCAKNAINSRKTPIASFYANLKNFFTYYEDKWFPYTMPISDLYGLDAAITNIENDKDMLNRHSRLALKCRNTLKDMGLTLYPESGFSNTVTAFVIPEGMTESQILDALKKDYNIMLAGSFGCFGGKLIRIGHMGSNANEEDLDAVLNALKEILG